MPDIDFSQIDDVPDFSPLPDGKYRCKLVEVEETSTQNGDEMWRLTLEVEAGEFRGRRIFDNMVFSKAAEQRVKLICRGLALNVAGKLTLTPGVVEGRSCYVTVTTESYEDGKGKERTRNAVLFAGYEPIEKEEGGGEGTSTAPAKKPCPF